LPVNRGFFVLKHPANPDKGSSMKTKQTKLQTIFEPETRFDVVPSPQAPFRATLGTGFDRLKEKLLLEQLKRWESRKANSQIRRAANEAESLALVTCYPLLVFPVLFEERIEQTLPFPDNSYKECATAELIQA
jgi:hypothetical protein